MNNHIYIFGEIHTKADRDRVEKEIINLFSQGKIKYLLSEEVGENIAITRPEIEKLIKEKNFSISDRSYKLGLKLNIPVIGIDNWDNKIYRKDKKKTNGDYVDCSYSFSIRENTMVSVIEKYGNIGPCAVIIGDSHLRYQPNSVMGGVSLIVKRFLNNKNVSIVRSPISELNDNNIVIVKGSEFNKNVFDTLIHMCNSLVKEEDQLYHTKFDDKVNEGRIPFNIDDFLFPDKETFCYVENNKIVSILGVFKSTDKLIILGPAYTNKEFRGKGMMSKMFNEVFKHYPKTKFGFSIGVIYANQEAIKLYKKLGFIPSHLSMTLTE